MIAEMAALKTALGATGRPVYDTIAPPKPSMPYHLIWSPAAGAPEERSVRAESLDFDVQVGVTTVGESGEGVRRAAAAARAALCPSGLPGSLTVTGRRVVVDLGDAMPIQADPDVMLRTGAHPLYGVQMYRLVSTPA